VEERAAFKKVKALAVTLGMPVTKAIQILTNDYKSYILLLSIASTSISASVKVKVEGKLNIKDIVDMYIIAIIKL